MLKSYGHCVFLLTQLPTNNKKPDSSLRHKYFHPLYSGTLVCHKWFRCVPLDFGGKKFISRANGGCVLTVSDI